MGGPVAQLLWRDHRDVVSGMVLCATGAEFVPGNRERYAMVALSQILVGTTRIGSLVGWLPGTMVRRVLNVPSGGSSTPMAEWARREMSKHSPRLLLEAGQAIATFSSKDWVHGIDVPTSVLVTTRDSAVLPAAQFRLASSIPNSHVNLLDDGHVACINPSFGRKLTDACLDVQRRIEQQALGTWPASDEPAPDLARRRSS